MSSKAKSTSAIGSLLDEMLGTPAPPTAPPAPQPEKAPTIVAPEPVATPPAAVKVAAVTAREKPAPPALPAPPRIVEQRARPQDTVAALESSNVVTTTIRIRSDVLERLRDYSAFSGIPMSRIITIGTIEVLDEMEKRYRDRGVEVPRRQSMRAEEIGSPRRS